MKAREAGLPQKDVASIKGEVKESYRAVASFCRASRFAFRGRILSARGPIRACIQTCSLGEQRIPVGQRRNTQPDLLSTATFRPPSLGGREGEFLTSCSGAI